MMTKDELLYIVLQKVNEGYFQEHTIDDFYVNYVLPKTKDSIMEILEQ